MNSFAALGDSDDEEVVVEKKNKPKVEKTEVKDTKKKEESKQKVNRPCYVPTITDLLHRHLLLQLQLKSRRRKPPLRNLQRASLTSPPSSPRRIRRLLNQQRMRGKPSRKSRMVTSSTMPRRLSGSRSVTSIVTITAPAEEVAGEVGGEAEARAAARAAARAESSDARSGSSIGTAAPAEAGRCLEAAEVQAGGATPRKRPT